MIKSKWIAGILSGVLTIVLLGAVIFMLDGFGIRPDGKRVMYAYAFGTIFACMGIYSLLKKKDPVDDQNNNEDPYAGGDLPPRHD